MRFIMSVLVSMFYARETTKVRKTRTITLSIGRNIGSIPMTEEDWQTFSGEVLRYVRRYSAGIHFIGYGEGVYEGMTEESFTVIASVYRGKEEELSYFVKGVCTTYSQEAFALSVSKVSIVEAS